MSKEPLFFLRLLKMPRTSILPVRSLPTWNKLCCIDRSGANAPKQPLADKRDGAKLFIMRVYGIYE